MGKHPENKLAIDAKDNRHPAPPPSIGEFFSLRQEKNIPEKESSELKKFRKNAEREIRKANQATLRKIMRTLKMYCESIAATGKPYPGWEKFERELSSNIAPVLLFLLALPRRKERLQLLEFWLDRIDLDNKVGRRRKDDEDSSAYVRGIEMLKLWQDEVKAVWQMKISLERDGRPAKMVLKKKVQLKEFREDVVNAVLTFKATPESSVAKLYAQRNYISEGRARNVLRDYKRISNYGFKLDI